jgi:hypothetical protein
MKWPDGFICPKCSSDKRIQLRCRELYKCNDCHKQTSLTSGTLFHRTHLPLQSRYKRGGIVSRISRHSRNMGLQLIEFKRKIIDLSCSSWSKLGSFSLVEVNLHKTLVLFSFILKSPPHAIFGLFYLHINDDKTYNNHKLKS